MKKRILCILLAAAVVFACVGVAFALEPVGSITVRMAHRGAPIPGGTVTIYRFAALKQQDWTFSGYTEDFADVPVLPTELDTSGAAAALAAYVQTRSIPGETVEVGSDGTAVFRNLDPGLYLVRQELAAPGYAPAEPFVVSVPVWEDGQALYDIEAAPKMNPDPQEPDKPDPDEPPAPPTPPEPDDPELPYTGQMKWPIPVLAAAGILLVIVGILLCRWGKRHET